jgi:hypothetical protein
MYPLSLFSSCIDLRSELSHGRICRNIVWAIIGIFHAAISSRNICVRYLFRLDNIALRTQVSPIVYPCIAVVYVCSHLALRRRWSPLAVSTDRCKNLRERRALVEDVLRKIFQYNKRTEENFVMSVFIFCSPLRIMWPGESVVSVTFPICVQEAPSSNLCQISLF